MEPKKIEPGKRQAFFDGVEGGAVFDGDAELGVVSSGRNGIEGVAIDAWGQAEHDGLAFSCGCRQAREAPHFIDAVKGNEADPGLEGSFELQFLPFSVGLLALLFLLALWVMRRIVESPLGKILQSIRDNELRAEALGYNVPRMKLAAFVVGGAFSGLAGALYAMLFGIVPLESIGFVFSGNVVFATLIGGSGSLYGPVIGSFVFIWLSESVASMWARWPLLLGVAFVVVVLFLRGGVVEAWARFWAWRYAAR